MSSIKDSKKKQTEDNAEDSQVSAHQTLMSIISSLQKLSQNEITLLETGDEPAETEELAETAIHVNCVICKQPIERSNYIVSLQCCGEIAHIKCFAKMSAPEQTNIPHECPKCKEKFSKEQIQVCQKLSSMIPY